MKTWHLLLVSIGCALSVQAADRNRGPLEQWRVHRVPEHGLLLIRWNEVVSNSVHTSISVGHSRRTAPQETNYTVFFRYADMPEAVVQKVYRLYYGRTVEIKGRDGLSSIAGRLRTDSKEPCTLGVRFETKEEAEIAADYLAGRTRRPRNTQQTDGNADTP